MKEEKSDTVDQPASLGSYNPCHNNKHEENNQEKEVDVTKVKGK
jgi:hypothetical protein